MRCVVVFYADFCVGSFLLAGDSGESGENNVKQSLAYVQLERQNERLKEALVRYVCCTCHFAIISDGLDKPS